MKTFYCCSAGCARNGTSLQRVYNYFKANGYKAVKKYQEADYIIIWTCGFHERMEYYSLSLLQQRIRYKKPNARIIALGCLSRINEHAILSLGISDLLGPSDLSQLDAIIGATIPFSTIPYDVQVRDFSPFMSEVQRTPYELAEKITSLCKQKRNIAHACAKHIAFKTAILIRKLSKKKTFHVHISRGCLGECSYCAIKKAKGSLSSRPLFDIIKDFEMCVQKKAKVIYLETEDLGCYGIDIGINVVDLLESIFKIQGQYQVILHDFNPQWLIKYSAQLKDIISSNLNKIALLTIPVQSASDRILQAMKRHYACKEVRTLIAEYVAAFPKLEMRLHIIVGFPGETDEDFYCTCIFLEWISQFKTIEVWYSPFSDLPAIPATDLPGKVAPELIMKRLKIIDTIVKRSVLDPVEYRP